MLLQQKNSSNISLRLPVVTTCIVAYALSLKNLLYKLLAVGVNLTPVTLSDKNVAYLNVLVQSVIFPLNLHWNWANDNVFFDISYNFNIWFYVFKNIG